MYFCKVCRYGFNNLNPDAGHSNTLCSRQCKAAQARIAALEAERDKLKESISHFSGLLGGETQKRYALESERDRLRELLKRYIDKHDDYIPCTDYACDICNLNDQAKALIGGEGKNG